MALREVKASELNILYIALPSVDEARKIPQELRKSSREDDEADWFLRSSGFGKHDVAWVDGRSGNIYDCGGRLPNHTTNIRPVLKVANLTSLNLNDGCRFRVNNMLYRVVSDDMIFSERRIGYGSFNDDMMKGNDYETSDIKHSIDYWAKREGFVFDSDFGILFRPEFAVDENKTFFTDKIKKVYERSGDNIIYKNVIDMITSDDGFDIKLLQDEFKAAYICYEKYKDVKLPRHEKSDSIKVVNDFVAESETQKSLGE